MQRNGEIALAGAGTVRDSSANEAALSDQNLTTDRERRAEALRAEMDMVMLEWSKRRESVEVRVCEGPALPMGTVYFVGPEGGPIKIGFARRLEYRLKDLRTMNAFPLIVHASVTGTERDERAYHKQFKAHRLHGEWFAPHPDILAEIARLQETTHDRP